MIIYYTDKYAGGREESHRLLGEAIAVHTGDKAQAEKLTAALKKGENGKPYIEGFSCFSISHTGNIWAVLVADRECGLDVQYEKNCNIRSISERFFNPLDVAGIADSDDFFRIWARREALAKAIGGTVYDTDMPPASCENASINGKQYTISDIIIPGMPELYAAVCLEGGPEETGAEFRVLQTEES